MSSRTKQRRSGGLTLLLYQRTLHPEATIVGDTTGLHASAALALPISRVGATSLTLSRPSARLFVTCRAGPSRAPL